ncbi:DUF7696 family protein [Burkholderia sp. MR1-5-21]
MGHFHRIQEARSSTEGRAFFSPFVFVPEGPVLPNRLDARIADVISNTIADERTTANTASPAWRARCEVAQVAMYSDPERRIFLSHIAERRGEAAANTLEQSASAMRTQAIFILARKPS